MVSLVVVLNNCAVTCSASWSMLVVVNDGIQTNITTAINGYLI